MSWVVDDFACVFLSKGSLGRMAMKRTVKPKMRPKVSSYFSDIPRDATSFAHTDDSQRQKSLLHWLRIHTVSRLAGLS